MKKMQEVVQNALEAMGIRYDYDQENEVFYYHLTSELTTYRQRLVPLEDEELLVTITSFPIKVPEDKRFLFASLLNNLNHSLLLGFYVMDPEDGEITFRISCPVDGGAINNNIVIVSVCTSIQTFDKHLPELLSAMGNLQITNYGQSVEGEMAYA